jgi:acyl phosphate:glycerol-3-phosphate acyltransferase
MIDPLGGPAYWLPFVIAFACGYLAGSVPFGLLLAKLGGAGDIRSIGSGNIGATNVLRTGRKGLALATLLFDIAKGCLPTLVAFAWLGPDIAIAVGLGTVLGHCFPVWLRFRGGKGVATAAGVILALTPLVLPIILALFIAIVWATRYVSLGSCLAAVAAPITAWLLGHVQPAELYVVLALVVVVTHRANIRRLVKGEESKLSFSTKKQ